MPKTLYYNRLFEPKKLPYPQRVFIKGSCNADAFTWLAQWPNKHLQHFCTFLSGPKGSGKKHMSHLWAYTHNAHIVRDNKWDLNALISHNPFVVINFTKKPSMHCEEKLFHLFNALKVKNGALLITSENTLMHLNFQLKDLKSRLSTAYVLTVQEPDEKTLKTLYITLFNQKGMSVGHDVVEYLLLRLERNFTTLHETVSILEQASCNQQKPITIPFVKSILMINY